ncbi:MAG: DEAD/DEAH box helicase [Gemmatimonadota bacterium]
MEPLSSIPLAEFQREAVQRASTIMERRRGVLIADSVGLGKTFVALGLIEIALARDQSVLLVVPASLRKMWRSELRRFGRTDHISTVSHTQLALGRKPVDLADVVVVDEAHAFRNPHTRRYRALKAVCHGARVALITATPVNNSLSDLYFLLRLFCSDNAFRDLGIGSMRAVLLEDRHAIDRLLRAVMVRRTRAEVRATAGEIRFPDRVAMHAVGYDLAVSIDRLRELLNSLTFVAHRVAGGAAFAPEILRFACLKRLESSNAAMRATLARQIRFYEQFTSALERGLLLRPGVFRSLYDVGDDALQLVLEGVTLEKIESISPDFANAARRELATLRSWRSLLSCTHDDKLDRLKQILDARPRGAKTIVFTEYRDTARHLWNALRRRLPVALIDGAGAWIGASQASRRQVIERFAPAANGGSTVHPREAVQILIATDVLAEGMNLQDADAVVSYDLPWNPIRLVQRAGRIDRIGSEHGVVSVYNFLPDREFDAFLGLARTIRTKLETVRSTVGLERPVLEPDEDFDAVGRALRAGDSSILDRIDGSRPARLREELASAGPVTSCGVPIAMMPDASGSRMLVGLRRGTEWEELVVDIASASDLAGRNADIILADALDDAAVRRFDICPFMIAAQQQVRAFEQRAAAARVDRRSVAAVAARLIRTLLAELPLEAGQAVYARVDAVMDRLTGELDAVAEDEVASAVRHRAGSLDDLLSALEKALSRAGISHAAEAAWTATGVIVAD